jgi:hypothetical protein
VNRTIHADGVVCQPSRNSSAKETESVTVSIDKGKPKDWTNKIQSERCGQSNPHRGGAKYADHRETALQGAQKISIDKGKPKRCEQNNSHRDVVETRRIYIRQKCVRQRKEMCPAESDFQMDAGRYQTETATHCETIEQAVSPTSR